MNTVQTLERGLNILFSFTRKRPWLTAKEIATLTDIPLSSVYRILSLMRKMDILEHDNIAQRYSVSLRFLEMSGLILVKTNLEKIAMPFVKKLAEETGETIQISVLENDYAICTHLEESSRYLSFVGSKVGDRLPLNSGASEQTILAFTSSAFQNKICTGYLRALTSNTITDSEKLKKRLKQIREQGYHVAMEEAHIGAMGIAAPIFESNNKVIASIAVAGPVQRLASKELDKYIRSTVSAANEISRILQMRYR